MGDFEDFFAEHYPRIVRSLVLALGDRAAAEDAAQEAFTRALRRWATVDTMERPGTWLYVVAVRHLRRWLGRDRRLLAREAMSSQTPVRDPAADVVTGEWIAGALVELPARQRLAIVLRYFAELNVAEVAEVMGCSEGTVKSTVHAALGRLRIALTDDALEGAGDGG